MVFKEETLEKLQNGLGDFGCLLYEQHVKIHTHIYNKHLLKYMKEEKIKKTKFRTKQLKFNYILLQQ